MILDYGMGNDIYWDGWFKCMGITGTAIDFCWEGALLHLPAYLPSAGTKIAKKITITSQVI